VFHLGRRDFLCIQPGCGQAFGYKHLLQRHAAKAHALQSESDPAPEEEDEQSDGEDESTSAIDGITGKAYAARSTNPRAMRCPHPCSAFGGTLLEHDPEPCDYWFTRAYDLRRHLAATHRVDVDKDTVDRWVVRSRG
jgi:general transcription factor IIIA